MSLVHALQGILCRTLLRTSHTLDNMYPGNVFFSSSLSLSLSLSLSYSLGYQQCMHAKQQRRELGSRIHITYAKGDEARDVTSLYVFLLPSFWEEQGRISDNERWISLSLSLHWINTWKWKHCGGVKCEGEDEIEKRKPWSTVLNYALNLKHAPLRDEDGVLSIREKLVLLTDKCSRQHKRPMIIDSWFWYPFTSHNANYAFY